MGRLGEHLEKVFFSIGRKERERRGRERKGGEGGKTGLSSAGHLYLDVVLRPSCYQRKSKAEK